MDTFNPASISGVTVAPYDSTADRTLLERLSNPVRLADMGAAFDAAERSKYLVDSHRSAENARADWFSQAADRVKAAAGVDLPNPYFAPPSIGSDPVGLINAAADPMAGRTRADLEREFFRRVGELVPAHPDLADIDPALVELGARGNAIAADRALGRVEASTDMNPLARFLGEAGGSIVGGLHGADPATLISFLLPVGGKGVTAVQRIADAALVQGAGGAVVSAAEQPGIQARRAELGLDAGLGRAASNVAGAALGGAMAGAAFQGVGETVGAVVGRLLRDPIAPKDMPAAIEAARAAGVHVSDDDAAALVAAARHDEAATAMLAERPDTVPDHAAAAQLADGLHVAEDPARPLPLMDRPIPAGTTDDLARRLTDPLGNPWDVVAALRDHEGARPLRIEEAARAAAPAVFARADALDGEIAALRTSIGALEVERTRTAAADQSALVGDQIAAIEARLATTKQGSKAAARLQEELARLVGPRDALAALEADLAARRLRLVEVQSDRGRLGPEIAAARREAEGRIEGSAIDSALASSDPDLRDMGRIALLDPSVADRVLSGELDRTHASIVAASSFDDATRGAAFAALEEARPASVDEARAVVSDAVSARNLPPPPDRLPSEIPPRTASGDLLSGVPIERGDGSVAVIGRDAIGRVAERERWMGDVVAACKL